MKAVVLAGGWKPHRRRKRHATETKDVHRPPADLMARHADLVDVQISRFHEIA
jgi:hypothetical protein